MALQPGTFGIFPAALCKGLHPYQQIIFTWLVFHRNQITNYCFPSYETLAKETCISKRSVIIHIRELEKIGYLKKVARKSGECGNKSNQYDIILFNGALAAPPGAGDALGGGAGDALGVVQEMHPNKKKVKQEEFPNQHLCSFEIFWHAYDYKKSIEDAKRAFAKINPSEELMQKILNAIELQKQEREVNISRGFNVPNRRYPATWLNGRNWEDEVNLKINVEKKHESRSGFKRTGFQNILDSIRRTEKEIEDTEAVC